MACDDHKNLLGTIINRLSTPYNQPAEGLNRAQMNVWIYLKYLSLDELLTPRAIVHQTPPADWLTTCIYPLVN